MQGISNFLNNISLTKKFLFLFGLTIVLFTTVLVTYVSVFLKRDLITREREELSLQAIKSADRFSYVFSVLNKITDEIINDDEIAGVITTDYPDRAAAAAAYLAHIDAPMTDYENWQYIQRLTIYTEYSDLFDELHLKSVDEDIKEQYWYRAFALTYEKGAYFWSVKSQLTEAGVRTITLYKQFGLHNGKKPGIVVLDVDVGMIGAEDQSNMRDYHIINPNGYAISSSVDAVYNRFYRDIDPQYDETLSEKSYFEADTKFYVSYYKFHDGTGMEKKWTVIYLTHESELLRPINQMITSILLICAIVFSILFAFLMFAVMGIMRRVKQLTKSTETAAKGDFSQKIPHTGKDEIGILAQNFNSMLGILSNLIYEVYQQQIELQSYELRQKKAEIQTLQAQINPHFLYNTLETIRMHALLQGDKEVSKMLVFLAKLFRYNIDIVNTQVLLKDELEYLKNYISMLNIRSKSNIVLQVELDDECLNTHVLKLLFQPIVENSIKHGFKDHQAGTIIIRGAVQDGTVRITVRDTGDGIRDADLAELAAALADGKKPESSREVGLLNVQNRIRLYFGEQYGLSVERAEPGTAVTVTLPYR